MINHPDIHLAYPVGPPGPDDHEGELTDGVRFVFRYRHGYAHLGLGRYRDDAEQDARRRPEWGIGNFGEQRFASPQERDLVFAGMLRARRAADYPRPPQRYVPPDPDGYRTGEWIMTNPAPNVIRAPDTGSQVWPANWNTLGHTADPVGDVRRAAEDIRAGARIVAYDGNVFNVPAESMVIRDADGSVRFRPREPDYEDPTRNPQHRPFDTGCDCRNCTARHASRAGRPDNPPGVRPGSRS